MKGMSATNRFITIVLVIMTVSLGAWKINAKAAENGEWKAVIFGQSVSADHNQITVDNVGKTVVLTAGSKDGVTAGGKVTRAHDGISYYYTEVDASKNFELSAKIKVNFFAKPKPDNQEAFGIMARDAIGKKLDTTVFPSNMVMVGGYRGLIQSVFRNGVNDPSGAGATMEDVAKFAERPADDGSSIYKMTLKKTNTGYHAVIDDGAEKIYYNPKQLEVLDKGHIYVGFFAARVASITVSDITFKTSNVASDPAGVPAPSKAAEPVLSVLSPATSGISSYNLTVASNVKGLIEIRQNGASIYNGTVERTVPLVKSSALIKGDNAFDLQFTPDATENVTSHATMSLKQVVTYKTYGKAGGAIYVSPQGKATATGSLKDPIDIYSAVQFTQPGQTIYVLGGTYNLSHPLVIEKGNDGSREQYKVLKAYSKGRPIFDFGTKANGFLLAGSYWRIYGIDITRAAFTGFRISGNYNLVELANTYANGDTGLQISGVSTDKIDKWPSYNLILNCSSYDNRDASENNADGFAAKLTCGVGNVFRGCISHNNCDDGWDLYSKLETGPIGAVTIENCVAYSNGTLSDGTRTKGDGNGFKMGGEGLPVKHVLRNSLAFKNNTMGVTSNSDPAIIVENTTSVDNGKSNFSFATYSKVIPQFIAKNNISFRTVPGDADLLPDTLRSADNYFLTDNTAVNSSGKKVFQSDFKSVTPVAFKRNANGTIAATNYLALKPKVSIKAGAYLNDYTQITEINIK